MNRFVPYLAEEAIERDAAALIAEFEHARGVKVEPPIPVEDIVEKHLKLRIEFDDMHARHNIPRPPNGQPDILGAIYGDGSIFIDESLDPEENPAREGRYRFTLAHEGGGHWRLHRHLIEQDAEQVSFFEAEKQPKFICRSSQSKAREEWQADFHASCLLMPQHLLFAEWETRFGDLRPRIVTYGRRLDDVSDDEIYAEQPIPTIDSGILQAMEDRYLEDFASGFAARFGVSRIAMRIRLEKLGLLRRDVPRQKQFAGLA